MLKVLSATSHGDALIASCHDSWNRSHCITRVLVSNAAVVHEKSASLRSSYIVLSCDYALEDEQENFRLFT